MKTAIALALTVLLPLPALAATQNVLGTYEERLAHVALALNDMKATFGTMCPTLAMREPTSASLPTWRMRVLRDLITLEPTTTNCGLAPLTTASR